MKSLPITIVLSSMVLFSCGGSGGGSSDGNTTTVTSTKSMVEKLANTSWKKECTPSKSPTGNSDTLWNVNADLTIDASLKSTYRAEYFHPSDTECNSVMFDSLIISKFEISGKVMTDESISAYGLNETFIYHSDNNSLAPNYSLIYMSTEKLYFGQKSGENLGKTAETRHSSISLDDYFSQVVN